MAGRTVRVQWHEDAETLRGLYQRERDPQRRTRLHALWLMRTGEAQGRVAAVLGVSVRAVQQWLAWYRAGGLEAVRSRRHGGLRTRYNAKLSEQQQAALRQWTRQGR